MIIQAKGIEKNFGQLKVLRGVDFSADKAEVVAIMGASGAGSSRSTASIRSRSARGNFPPSATARSASSSRPTTFCRNSARWKT